VVQASFWTPRPPSAHVSTIVAGRMLSCWGGAPVQSAMTPGYVAPGTGGELTVGGGLAGGADEGVGTGDAVAGWRGEFAETDEVTLVPVGELAAAFEWPGPHPATATAVSIPRMAAVVSFMRAVRIPLLTREQP
jgi:hypothetical protein